VGESSLRIRDPSAATLGSFGRAPVWTASIFASCCVEVEGFVLSRLGCLFFGPGCLALPKLSKCGTTLPVAFGGGGV